ncbi:hypothetical protein ACFWAN_32720 [Streptomyces mirabilis]|uniref:hypothetical protein n=1 Tax=Streptomyces mirabilis TaxID=68239 RepID=UPI003657B891
MVIFLSLWADSMTKTDDLPRFLISYGGRDHRLAYTDENVRNSLRGVYGRYGTQALSRAAVYALPSYEDVTARFVIGESCEPAPF